MSPWYRRCAFAVVMVGAGLAVLIGFAGPSYVGNRRWGRLRRLVSLPAGLAEAIASLFIAPLVAVCILLDGVHGGQKWGNGEFDLMWVAGLVCAMTPICWLCLRIPERRSRYPIRFGTSPLCPRCSYNAVGRGQLDPQHQRRLPGMWDASRGESWGEGVRRWLFNFAALVSLLLCAATLATWFYSYSDREFMGSFCQHDSETSRAIFVDRGRLFYWAYWISGRAEGVSYEVDSDQGPWHWDGTRGGVGDTSLKSKWIAGFGYNDHTYQYEQGSVNWGNLGTAHEQTYWVPLWALIGAFAILPLIAARRVWRHFRRPGPGFCPTCRYELRGNTSGTCPECGTPVAKEPAEKSPRTA